MLDLSVAREFKGLRNGDKLAKQKFARFPESTRFVMKEDVTCLEESGLMKEFAYVSYLKETGEMDGHGDAMYEANWLIAFVAGNDLDSEPEEPMCVMVFTDCPAKDALRRFSWDELKQLSP